MTELAIKGLDLRGVEITTNINQKGEKKNVGLTVSDVYKHVIFFLSFVISYLLASLFCLIVLETAHLRGPGCWEPRKPTTMA